jgi:hypothetical protein
MTPSQHLARLTALFPKFWHQYERLRSDAARLRRWPSWCYCPLAGAYAIVSGGGSNRVPRERTSLIGELGAVAAWRPSKGIYRFDADLAAALVSTPLERDLPPGVLERLPEWCVWVDPVAGLPGFFAFLEHDANDRRSELRIAIDNGGTLAQVIVHLEHGTLSDGVAAAFLEGAALEALRSGRAVPSLTGSAPQVARSIAPFVSLLLYLCSEEPDVTGKEPLQHPNRRARATGAQAESVWMVGERVGSAVREARSHADSDGEGVHSSPRAHVRRAHWHTYWTGTRGAQTARCRWLVPILVGAGETIPTRHEVVVVADANEMGGSK